MIQPVFNNLHFLGTCQSAYISKIVERVREEGKRARYTALIKAIKRQMPELYYDLALEYYNPWKTKTYRTEDLVFLTHSLIEYLFSFED